MNILCDSVAINANTVGDKRIKVICEGVRVDVLLQDVIDEKGIDFVLNAIGEAAIQSYMRAKGCSITDNWKTFQPALMPRI